MDFNDPATQRGIHGAFRLPLRRSQKGNTDETGRDFELNVQLQLPGSGITGIFGPSGSGKTTLLRCIAGLQRCDEGRLKINGQVWQDGKQSLPTHRRPLGYVFQEPSLLPHLSARDNLEFARKRAATGSRENSLSNIVHLMGIQHLLEQMPAHLSGGEQQRVAIARALLINPKILLMDEPLASLDQMRKREILPYLERLHQQLEIPILYVSHAVDEIARLADHLLLLEDGKLMRQGSATELLSQADFPVQLGNDLGVLLEAKIVERDSHWQLVRARFNAGDLWLRDTGEASGDNIRIRVLARDISVTLNADTESSILNRLPVRVGKISADRDPAMVLVHLATGVNTGADSDDDALRSATLIARITWRSAHQLELRTGLSVWAQIKSVALVR